MRDKLYNTFGPVGGGAHPLDTASIWSKIGFSWAEPLIALGNQRQLSPDDLWSLQSTNNVAKLTSTFSGAFKSHSQGVIRAFFAVYLWKYLWLGLLQLFTAVCDLYGPGFVLGQIIATLEAPTFDTEYVLKLVGSLFVVMTASALVKAHVAFLNDILGIQFTASLRSMVFTKALKLSAKSRKEKSAGDIANLFGTDVLNMMEFANYSHQLWIVPVQILIVLGLLYRLVGCASLVGLAIVGLVLWINSRSAIALGKAEMQLLKRKDDRTKLLTELFGAIQIVKFNAWEEKFGERAQGLRDLEVGALRVFYKYLILIQSLLGCTPVLVALSVFATFTLGMKQVLTVTVVFSTVALFKSLQEAIESLPVSITTFMQSLVSAKRLNAMLVMEVVDQTKVQTPANIDKSHEYAEEHVVVAIEDGSFGWDADNLLFRNINLKVHQGELVVIHGAVGQGKSSLCSILLGEMVKTNGSVFVGGQVAYFSQQPWIQNTTIRENILFGKPYDRTKYDKVIDACALAKDMASFPAGDRTEIGAKGLNLSGGQKARVSLARACYSNADVFILDSPLSAVDAIVSSEIFRKCFQGLLHHKTVLLVTHNPEIIASPEVAKAYLIQDGQITESTRSPTTLSPAAEKKSPEDLPLVSPLRQRRPYWEFDHPIEEHVVVREHDLLLTPTASTPYNFETPDVLFTPRAKDDDNQEDGRLIQAEGREEGRVSKEVVFKYLKFVGGWPAVAVVLFTTAGMQTFKIGSDLWLTQWSNTAEHLEPAAFQASINFNMGVYASLALACCVFTAVENQFVYNYCVRGANRIFSDMLASILRAPMRFFDTTPIGRLLTRFGDDIIYCDFFIPYAMAPMIFELSSALLTIGTTLVLTQWFGLLILPLLWIYIRIGSYSLAPLREVTRIQRTTRSPLFSMVSEGIDGSATIRAFGDNQLRRFNRILDKKIEDFCAARFASSCINQWFSIRIQLLSIAIVTILLLAVAAIHHLLNPGLVGLLITYGLTIPSNLAFLVNIWS
ncbi:unnamed protein product, partial [Aphanomyces euteiches]